jgi:O-antigen biosynthesis protein WbqV
VLGRADRSLDSTDAQRYFEGATVLVTGAGGSIGGELCRGLLRLGCRQIIELDYSDHALINLLEGLSPADRQRTTDVLCDVRDLERLTAVFCRFKPDAVIHAAALKHVHMGDRHPTECVLTNLVGVRNAALAASRANVGRFLLISSDKAAAPVSVMGACKRLAELFLHGFARELAARGSKMRLASVRFGNVFGSAGSVVPLFLRQIAQGGPLTLTHLQMRRYFMTLHEAVGLILNVTALVGEKEPAVATYLLDMGRPVRIVDLAHRLMEITGKVVPIEVCGLREGEKLDEQLFDAAERFEPCSVEGVTRLAPFPDLAMVGEREVEELENLSRSLSDQVLRSRVFAYLDMHLREAIQAAG